jgi:hypothetical protein
VPTVGLDNNDIRALAAITDAEVEAFRVELESHFAAILPHGI